MIFGIIFLSLSIAAYIAGIAWIYWDIKNEERGRKNLSGVQCKKCRYLLKDKEGYNWCPNKDDDPDLDLIRDCEWYAVKTNADRIRSMTDEELARYIVHLVKQGNRQVMADYECGLNWLRDEYDRFFFDEWLKERATE